MKRDWVSGDMLRQRVDRILEQDAVNPQVQISLSATNLFNEGHRETVGSPKIRRLILTELRYLLR